MSYGAAAELQTAIFQSLSTDPALAGTPVIDAVPPGGVGGTFILLGPEEVSDASDKSGGGADHRLTISVISDATGFLPAKSTAATVSTRLNGSQPTLGVGRVVSIRFVKASARRLDDGNTRRIDLVFRARVEI